MDILNIIRGKSMADFFQPQSTYLLLVIPSLFAVTVILQGLYTLARGEGKGLVIMGFGAAFACMIAGVYFFVLQ